MKLAEFNAALESGAYAWPGGYALRAIMADGESLCFPCLEREAERIREELGAGAYQDREWIPVQIAPHWEGAPETCAHCNAELPAEFGNPEEPETPAA